MQRSLLLALLLLQGCASAPAVRTWLDPNTAATITAQGDRFVLARDEQMRALNVRDYAQLAALEVNRMGERRLYLIVILWSTIDRASAEREQLARAFERIRVDADDRPIALTRIAGERRAMGIGTRPFDLPAPGSQEIYFPIRRDELQAIALSRSLHVTTQGDAQDSRRYDEWRDAREGLRRFIAALPR